MTATRQPPQSAEATRFARFEEAERAVWDYYGLTPEERLVGVGSDQVVRVHDVGKGEPILFVHGTGGSGVYWAPLVKELASDFRCLLMDRPGWTRSTPIDYSQNDFGTIAAGLLEGLLSGLRIDRVHVIGGSIGGLYALRLALQHPNRVNKVVLLGGLPDRRFAPPTFVRLLRTPLGRIIIRIPQKPGMIRKQLGGLGHKTSLDRGQIPSELIDLFAATSRYTEAMRHERDLVGSVMTRDGLVPGFTLSDTDLAGINASTLMIYGNDDPTGSAAIWDEFTRTMLQGSLQVIPDSGHLVWYDDPEQVGRYVRDHLAERT